MTRRADRLLALLELLRSLPVSTAANLATTLEVSIRTVYRDIDALVATGVPVRGEAGVGYMLEAGYHLPPLNLTAEEAEALALGARVLATWSDGAVAGQAAAALAKVRAVLPASGQAGVDQDIFWAPQWVERHAPRVDLLELKRAAQRRRVLVIEYEALDGARTTRTVRPLSINFFGPVWLLAAWCELAGDFRCFRLDRIDSVTLTGAIFRDEDGKRLADFKRIKGEEARVAEFDTSVTTEGGC
ncbi:YafY family protein [Sphingomonas sp.]|jgi:predicted DNA-binding transcriptional regulator YafY|uniref:helix-turn-helix transcriptional regulator n=1 Tax=Sphingomonas sp. TaxID=28214 RepID=UPI002D7FABBD|nr:YafY family protein [Sphingomonas sp.]HEU0045608.1 YafY family protein [Sphingomonas sp.]